MVSAHRKQKDRLRLKSGRTVTAHEAENEARTALNTLRLWSARALTLDGSVGDSQLRKWNLDRLDHFFEDIEYWAQHMRELVDAERGHGRKGDRIRQLREIGGRTAEEATLYLAKADELEHEEDR